MRTLPYALALLVGGVIGWKLERAYRRHRFMQALNRFTAADDLMARHSGLDAPVPCRIVPYTPDQFYCDDAPCYGEATTPPGTPCS